jgi:hypothetical protein
MTDKPSYDELRLQIEDLANQSDRGMAIVLAASLEERMRGAIRSHFNVINDDTEKLLDFDQPLGTFSAKSRFLYAFGIIGPLVFSDLEYLRKIRNRFAHSVTLPGSKGNYTPLSFEYSHQIRDWCLQLRTYKKFDLLDDEHFKATGNRKYRPFTVREMFQQCAGQLAVAFCCEEYRDTPEGQFPGWITLKQ